MTRPTPDHPTQQHQLLDAQHWSNGWEDHELEQLRRRAAWTLLEKVRWLEEAQELALGLREAREEIARKRAAWQVEKN